MPLDGAAIQQQQPPQSMKPLPQGLGPHSAAHMSALPDVPPLAPAVPLPPVAALDAPPPPLDVAPPPPPVAVAPPPPLVLAAPAFEVVPPLAVVPALPFDVVPAVPLPVAPAVPPLEESSELLQAASPTVEEAPVTTRT